MLTIGLPFFNNAHTLANAVKSVLLQSFTDWEMILIDDGSTDGSVEIAASMVTIDSRLSLVSDGSNKGLITRLNQIIDMAKGDFIARMDADDMMLPEKLQWQMEVLLKNKHIDVIDTAAYTINEQDEPTGLRGTEDIATSRKEVIKNVLLFHPTVIAKTSWFKLNRYSPDFLRAEDYELWNRTFETTVFHRIKKPLFLYREGKVNVKNYALSMTAVRKVIKRYGPTVLNKQEIVSEILKTYAKSALYVLFGFFSQQQYLATKRNMPLSNDEVEKVKKMISFIKNTA